MLKRVAKEEKQKEKIFFDIYDSERHNRTEFSPWWNQETRKMRRKDLFLKITNWTTFANASEDFLCCFVLKMKAWRGRDTRQLSFSTLPKIMKFMTHVQALRWCVGVNKWIYVWLIIMKVDTHVVDWKWSFLLFRLTNLSDLPINIDVCCRRQRWMSL